jgi:hypothetical protein
MTRHTQPFVALFVFAMAIPFCFSGGCGSNKNNGAFVGADNGSSSSGGGAGFGVNSSGGSSSGGGISIGPNSSGAFMPTGGGDDGGANCPAGSPLSCYVNTKCASPTTITGKVYDPAGKNPLQNVVVFVPNNPSTLPAIDPGTSTCSSCDTSIGDYVTFALSGADGSFKLTGVPTGKDVPLVMQIGKWRRMITVAQTKDCGTVTVPDKDPGQARLPRNRTEGDMPQMALLTGGLDDLGCFLTRMGIDAAEYSPPGGGGRLDIYQGLTLAGLGGPKLSNGTAGNCTNTSCPLWASKASFEKYDIVLLACEGDTFDSDALTDGGLSLGGNATNVTPTGKQALHDWLDEGGKVFATHFHYTWFMNGPADFRAVAQWRGYSLGTGTCPNCQIDQSFQGGKDFYTWLQTAGALSGGGISLNGVADSVAGYTMGTTDRWIYGQSATLGVNAGAADDTKYLSFNTPIGGIPIDGGSEVGGKQYCGKAVFTDLHAGGAPSGDVPGSCKQQDLSSQEKALEYLLFDLSACVRDESKPPPPPPPPPPK